MMSSGPRLLEIYFPLTLLAFLIRTQRKKELISNKVKIKKLKHTTVRYLDCLKRDFPFTPQRFLNQIPPPNQSLQKTIGIAPFSKHQQTWPLERHNEHSII